MNLVLIFESTRRSREVFSDRDVTHRVKLVWLHLEDRLLFVITLSYSEVLILLLEFVLPMVRAISFEMPGLSTIVEKAGRKFLRLGNLLLIFLDDTKLLSLLCS
jgi:hypothetical protein